MVLRFLDINDYGPKNNRGYRYVLVVIDNFSEFGWTIPLKNKYAQSITDTFSEIIKSSNREPNLLETDDGKEYVNKIRRIFETEYNKKNILETNPWELFLLKDLLELYVIY